MKRVPLSISYQPNLERKPVTPTSTIFSRLVFMTLGLLAGLGVIFLLLRFYTMDAEQEATFLPSDVMHNTQPIKYDGKVPGPVEMDIEYQFDPNAEGGSSTDVPDIPGGLSPGGDVITEDLEKLSLEDRIRVLESRSDPMSAQLLEYYRLEHAALVEVSFRIDGDTTEMTPSEIEEAEKRGAIYDQYDFNLKREWFRAERSPLPGADLKDGPYYLPFQMETPRIAFDFICRDVGKLDANALKSACNEGAYFFGDYPQVVPKYRGTVFGVQNARLWMLREQPLRASDVTLDGKPVEKAYYGVAVFLREGVGRELQWINQAVAFTTLSLPEELKAYAIAPGEHPSNSDKLAKEVVNISLRGAYFRRIMYREPLRNAEVSLKGSDDHDELYAQREFWSEAYVPWLVCQGIEKAESAQPEMKNAQAIISQFDEETVPFNRSKKDRFDEAGYYLLLRSVAHPETPAPHNHPDAEELTFRLLLEQYHRNAYRGAHVDVKGSLASEYFLMLLPPNVSGRRHVYRTFVLDALERSEERTDLQWYVDTLEPPTEFRGRAHVQVDGFYYRSQIFQGKTERGQPQLYTFPLLITKQLKALGDGAASEDTPMNWTTVWVTVGVVGSVIVLLVVLARRDYRSREKFERETLATVRRKLGEARERISKNPPEKKGENESDGETRPT